MRYVFHLRLYYLLRYSLVQLHVPVHDLFASACVSGFTAPLLAASHGTGEPPWKLSYFVLVALPVQMLLLVLLVHPSPLFQSIFCSVRSSLRLQLLHLL